MKTVITSTAQARDTMRRLVETMVHKPQRAVRVEAIVAAFHAGCELSPQAACEIIDEALKAYTMEAIGGKDYPPV